MPSLLNSDTLFIAIAFSTPKAVLTGSCLVFEQIKSKYFARSIEEAKKGRYK
jgi:hypothetical protein